MLRLNVEKFIISRIERGIGFHSRRRAYDKARFFVRVRLGTPTSNRKTSSVDIVVLRGCINWSEDRIYSG